MLQRSLLFSIIVLAACNSGGSSPQGGQIAGLQGPQQVTLLDADDPADGTGSTSVRIDRGLLATTTSDYESDRTRFWVRDESMQALDTVNSILGSLRQTRYWEQTNQGPYLALVKEDEDHGSGGGPTYREWTVDSTRADNSSPQIVRFWIPQPAEEGGGNQMPTKIQARMTIAREPGAGEPLGSFELVFKVIPDNAAPTEPGIMSGYLRTVARTDGRSEVEFHMRQGDVGAPVGVNERAVRERARIVSDPATASGRAYTEVRRIENQGGSVYQEAGEYLVQYDADYVARKDLGSAQIEVFDRNDYRRRVHRYQVYDAGTEQRVARLAGFPIQTAAGANGWAGYHGVWFPNGVSVAHGQTVWRRSWGSAAPTEYTLVVVPGKLQRRTRQSLTLGDIVGEDLQGFDPVGGTDQRVRFDGTDFLRVATRVEGQWQPVEPPTSITVDYTPGQWLAFWSPSRGSVELAWPHSLSPTTPIHVWVSETVTSDSPELSGGALVLHGYQRLLRSNISSDQANFQNGQSPYLPDASSASSGNRVYMFSASTLMLTLDGEPVDLEGGVTIGQGPGLWGFTCGPLFPTALSSLSDIPNQTVTYEWTIGPNPWNQLRALRAANGGFVGFDAPLRFQYQHDEPGSPLHGRTFFLEWDGANLGGLPYEQDEASGRWVPRLNVPTGTVLHAGDRSYKVKQIEGDQVMVPVSDPNGVYQQRGFDLESNPLTAPDFAPYQDPGIGAAPTVTAPPRYVAGVAQFGSDG